MRSGVILCAVTLAVLAPMARAGGDAQRIDTGRRVYVAHCAACHGARGEGQPAWDRPDAAGELPAPPHDPQGHTWKHSDAVLYRIVKNGWRDPFNKTRRLTMPAFGRTLSAREMRDVVEYLKTMWTPEQKAFQKEMSRQAPFPPEAR
jgi:mono/diheme cytochrome c family protein